MARRLLDGNRQREARRQVILLDKLAAQFRGQLERELKAAMRDMIDRWEATQHVEMPRGFLDRIGAVYAQMAQAAIEAFGGRILGQGKHLGLVLERKEDFAQIMRRRALQYIQQEAVRRRIQRVTETTRRQIVNAVDSGYREGSTLPEVASSIRGLIPAIARYRADAIARTETHGAANYGSNEAAKLTGLPLRREWLAAEDERTRETHKEADGQIVGQDEAFSVGGELLMYPGDPSGSPEETVNCFAPWSLIHMGGLRAAMFRDYAGDLIELSVGSPVNLTVTPNHPVLTARGWVAAGQIMEGDQLIKCKGADFIGARVNPEIGNGYAPAHQLYDFAQSLSAAMRPHGVAVDLHGEVIPGHNVDIVPFKGDLLAACNAPSLQLLDDFSLPESDISHGRLLALRMLGLSDGVPPDKANGPVSSGSAGKTLLGREESGAERVSFGNARAVDSHVGKAIVDHGSGNPRFLGYPVDGVSGGKEALDIGMMLAPLGEVHRRDVFSCELAPVIAVRRFHYAGPVLNFESANGLLISDSIITHNCRCTLGYIVDDGIDDWVDPYENPAGLT
jgi:hypothetical protein